MTREPGPWPCVASLQATSMKGGRVMASTPKVVHVEPGSELDRALDDADENAIQIERDGVRYRLERVVDRTATDIWDGYDPDIARAGMRAAAGTWSDIDVEHLKAELYRAREEGSRSLERP